MTTQIVPVPSKVNSASSTALGERLGLPQPQDLRKIKARHGGALSQMGALPEIEEVVGSGQRVQAYYLNRKQGDFHHRQVRDARS